MNDQKLFVEFPVIETENLKLRLITNEDSNDILSIFSSESVTKYYGMYRMTDISEAEILIGKFHKSIEESKSIRWGIELKRNNKIIGTCGYHNWNKRHYRAEIGYELNKEFWGKGYATEAILSIIEYGFNEMELERIEALVYPKNIKSEKMLKKLNFIYEGCLSKYAFFRDKQQDLNSFSLIKESRDLN